MHAYAQAIQATFAAQANPQQAGPMKRYMRDQFEFLGLKTPERTALMKDFIASHGLPAVADLESIVLDLWALPAREYQYTALGLVQRLLKKLPAGSLSLLEKLVVTKSWWDTVDGIAGNLAGPLLQRYPDARPDYLPRWRASENLWLRRTCILFQLDYKQATDFALLGEIIGENLGSNEFFINKAIGWALREYSKTDAEAVRAFIAATPLQPLSAREGLEWVERKQK